MSIRCQRLTQAVHLKKSYCHSVLARERDRADGMLDPGVVPLVDRHGGCKPRNQSFALTFMISKMVAHRMEMASAS